MFVITLSNITRLTVLLYVQVNQLQQRPAGFSFCERFVSVALIKA